MATNIQKLASQIRDIFSGGNPNSNTRVSQAQIELLITQMAPALRVQNFREMYDQFGVHMVNGQFVKDYNITLTTGGTGWKKAVLPASILALPTDRGIAYIYQGGTLKEVERIPKSLLGNLAGGLLQSTGKYFACVVGSYLEIRGDCNEDLPNIRSIDIGLVVPDESQVDEALDLVIIERVLAILRGVPLPDKNVNANPQ